MKKLFSLILMLVTLASLASGSFIEVQAIELPTKEESIEVVQGDPVVCESVLLLNNGFVCITVSEDEEYTATPFGYTEKEKTKSFTHEINDRNGQKIADLITTVTGVYSYADNYATITSVAGYYSNEVISGLDFTVSYNGDTATVYIRLNGVAIGSLSYRLYTNGSLLQI